MDWINHLGTAEYALIIGSFLAPLFVLIAKKTKGKRGSAANSTKWPTVNGLITASSIKEQSFFAEQRKVIKGWKNTKAYTPSICYDYSYKGTKHTGSKIAPDKTISSNEKLSDDVIARYPVGKSVLVYVNPKKPSQAYLEPKNMALRSFMLTGFFAVLFPAIAVLVVYFSR